jgi:hypothetical protein
MVEVRLYLNEQIDCRDVAIEEIDDLSTIPAAVPYEINLVGKAENIVVDKDDNGREGGVPGGAEIEDRIEFLAGAEVHPGRRARAHTAFVAGGDGGLADAGASGER